MIKVIKVTFYMGIPCLIQLIQLIKVERMNDMTKERKG